MTFQLSIISLEGIEFRDKVWAVICPGTEGELTVLANHVSLVTGLKDGFVTVKKNKDDAGTRFHVAGGTLEVKKDEAVILITKT